MAIIARVLQSTSAHHCFPVSSCGCDHGRGPTDSRAVLLPFAYEAIIRPEFQSGIQRPLL